MAVERLKISCFGSLNDAKQNKKSLGSITVAANPESVSFTLNVETEDNKDTGDYSGSVDFTLILDGSGVLYNSDISVAEQVDFLKKVAIAYHKTSKSTSFVKLDWGTVFSGIGIGESSNVKDNYFIGKVTSLSIKYTLFSQNGDPLRATVDMSVEQLVDLGQSGKFSKHVDFSSRADETTLENFKRDFQNKLKQSFNKTGSKKGSSGAVKVGTRI